MLRYRAKLLQRIRQFFDDKGFFEVETPLLSHDTVVDRYLNPIAVSKATVTGSATNADQQMWLQTSPEYGMKRLVAAGAEAIYQIGKCFRQSEFGDRHNPEFTMLEWYRVGDGLIEGMDLLGELVVQLADTPPFRCLSYREAFQRHAGIDPFSNEIDRLYRCAKECSDLEDLEMVESNRDEFLNIILSEKVEPNLGGECPEIVFDWPESQAALAVVREESEGRLAERFELYLKGVELANGYHELLDADELDRRSHENNLLRESDGSQTLPSDSRLSEAMRFGMPGCSGVAMGVDRLMMVLTGVGSIREVIAFPFDVA